jgi:vacuolar iron transporter family protein
MSRLHNHPEQHLVSRIGWLRAAVLGANDGIVSTASLIIGVAVANAARGDIMVAGAAGLVAGAMSMAAGEYVSVSSQADTEEADLQRESAELAADPDAEHAELANIYVARGLTLETANDVARQLMEKDALAAHTHDELAITEHTAARPIQAAFTSAGTFTLGAALPLLLVIIVPIHSLVAVVAAASLIFLAFLGAIGARAGGAPVIRATTRVTFWGALAMAITAGIGLIVGTAV